MTDPGLAMQPSLADARYVSLHEGEQPVPGFRLVRRRGRGGFGEVWEAEASGGFLVALKFVRLSNRARTAELRALEFVRGIHHPNLLANFGSWLVADTLIIGMELADRSLWDRHVEATQQGYLGIPRGELLGYLAEVAAGIDHLNGYRHTFDGRTSIGVQHRDLKPPNILLFGGGAKVADLGMARAMEGEVAGHTGIWTFSYAAPEFFRGETTRQSDQYGLAATFCQLRGGRPPFGGNAASLTMGHLFGRPDLDALPEPERPIVERALAKVPGDRWPNCRAFVEALRAIPADAVADILIDSEDSSSIPPESRSSDDAGSHFSLGFATSGSGVMDSWWQQDMPPSGSTVGRAFVAEIPEVSSPSPTTGDDPPRSPDFVPTLVLPAPAPSPMHGAVPKSSRRPVRYLRYVAIAASTALTLAVVAIQTPNRDQKSQTTQSPIIRKASPILDSETDTVPSSVPRLDVPILPIEISEILKDTKQDGEPRSELAPSSSDLVKAESIAPESGPSLIPVGADSPPPTEVATAALEDRPGPGPIAEGRRDLVLEGPVEMDVAAPGVSLPLSRPRGSGASRQPGPPAIASKTVDKTSRPLDAGATGTIASPTVPDRSIPDRDSRPVAPKAPSETLGFARNRDANPTSPPDRAGPSSAEAAFARGRDLFRNNSFAQAVAEFDESIRLDPGHITSYLVRGIARHRTGDPQAALADYAEVIRARPDDITAYVSRGQAYHELKAYDRAIADYDEAIRRQPGDSDARFRRGLTRYRSGDYTGSIGDFTETLRLNPNAAYAAEFRAEALARHDPKNVHAPSPESGPTQPSSVAASPPTTPRVGNPSASARVAPATAGVSPGSSAITETNYLAPPTSTRPGVLSNEPGGRYYNPTPASRPGSKPNPAERRRSPIRRLLPLPKSK